ncbi:putative Reverse transcriptase, LTR Retrotransposon protein [Trachipleistophora hominis]|uniref:Putative Reverse transcriptase, LTR Retrotransposon protein n=1 Tax=Trachipleistophora hominis TaxID=72359 RepID=L7JS50_TRAHO|nr:putative Reverse transcriptase, LTR Retrotransposon protein [Trachipleistophora hominis]
MINNAFYGIINVAAYLDDIIIFTLDAEEHKTVLEKVLQRFKQLNITINFDKLTFF